MKGKRVRFVPHIVPSQKFAPAERKAANVIGKIVYVNLPHKYFTAQWGGQFLESFKFTQLGSEVKLLD